MSIGLALVSTFFGACGGTGAPAASTTSVAEPSRTAIIRTTTTLSPAEITAAAIHGDLRLANEPGLASLISPQWLPDYLIVRGGSFETRIISFFPINHDVISSWIKAIEALKGQRVSVDPFHEGKRYLGTIVPRQAPDGTGQRVDTSRNILVIGGTELAEAKLLTGTDPNSAAATTVGYVGSDRVPQTASMVRVTDGPVSTPTLSKLLNATPAPKNSLVARGVMTELFGRFDVRFDDGAASPDNVMYQTASQEGIGGWLGYVGAITQGGLPQADIGRADVGILSIPQNTRALKNFYLQAVDLAPDLPVNRPGSGNSLIAT